MYILLGFAALVLTSTFVALWKLGEHVDTEATSRDGLLMHRSEK